MKKDLEIELFNELPKFHWSNEKYFLLRGRVNNVDTFNSCTLLINENEVATSASYKNYSKTQQRVLNNTFQFLIELPTIQNEQRTNVALKISINNKERFVKLASIPVKEIPAKFETKERGMIAVCMPLYQPGIKLFQQQLESIQKQSYQNIKIFMQDDGSEPAVFNEVEEYVSAFDNVVLLRNESNLGFYKNIELLLNKIGDAFEYIALSDQDDIWELDKLEKQVNYLKEQNADLCYTNLNIIDENRKVLQQGFWNGRSNHLKNSLALNFQNVATGSTMLFKQSVLKEVLPFPQQLNNIFHDHYICAQLQNSLLYKVVYLDESLTNYIQHQNNVTGFSKYKIEKFSDKLIGDIATIKLFLQLIFQSNINRFESFIVASNAYYQNKYQLVKLFLLHQQKLSYKQFFSNWIDLKITIQAFFLSYQMHTGNLRLSKFDIIAYKNIGIQIALKLRYLLYKK